MIYRMSTIVCSRDTFPVLCGLQLTSFSCSTHVGSYVETRKWFSWFVELKFLLWSADFDFVSKLCFTMNGFYGKAVTGCECCVLLYGFTELTLTRTSVEVISPLVCRVPCPEFWMFGCSQFYHFSKHLAHSIFSSHLIALRNDIQIVKKKILQTLEWWDTYLSVLFAAVSSAGFFF
jgi:hypothetical protein